MDRLLIPQDKANHFVYGALSALLGVLIGGPIAGVAVAAAVALVREATGDAPWSWPDVAWTVAGGASVALAAAFG